MRSYPRFPSVFLSLADLHFIANFDIVLRYFDRLLVCRAGARPVARHFNIAEDRNQDLYSGLIRLHILHHACEEPIFGLGMIEELGRHGYRLSAGTIYPMLHRLETSGLLRSQEERNGRRRRRTYRATRAGEKALAAAKQKVWELFSELFEDQYSRTGNSRAGRKG